MLFESCIFYFLMKQQQQQQQKKTFGVPTFTFVRFFTSIVKKVRVNIVSYLYKY